MYIYIYINKPSCILYCKKIATHIDKQVVMASRLTDFRNFQLLIGIKHTSCDISKVKFTCSRSLSSRLLLKISIAQSPHYHAALVWHILATTVEICLIRSVRRSSLCCVLAVAMRVDLPWAHRIRSVYFENFFGLRFLPVFL